MDKSPDTIFAFCTSLEKRLMEFFKFFSSDKANSTLCEESSNFFIKLTSSLLENFKPLIFKASRQL
jgi:hypothetical protein